VTTRDLRDIDWAAVAATAREDLGNELVARFSERLRTTMTAHAAHAAQLLPLGWLDPSIRRPVGDRRVMSL
jgi:hypothetical protein